MVSITLLQSKPISSRMNVPASTRVIKSLIFEFPRVEGQSLSHEETLNQEVVEKTQEVLGMRPLLPLPRLTEARVQDHVRVSVHWHEVHGEDLLRHPVPCWNQPIHHAHCQEGQGGLPPLPSATSGTQPRS